MSLSLLVFVKTIWNTLVIIFMSWQSRTAWKQSQCILIFFLTFTVFDITSTVKYSVHVSENFAFFLPGVCPNTTFTQYQTVPRYFFSTKQFHFLVSSEAECQMLCVCKNDFTCTAYLYSSLWKTCHLYDQHGPYHVAQFRSSFSKVFHILL